MLLTLRRNWLICAGAIGVFLVIIAGAVVLSSPRLTRYVESDRFRHALEKETAEGLHFPSAQYSRIRRTGFLMAQSESFRAGDGKKALKATDAHDIRAGFDPWGVFLRRWQLDELHIQSSKVEIQIYEHKPESPPAKPWFSIFLPNRVYLKRVETERADVTWRFRGAGAGFFGTRLLITPHDRDFNYEATGGTLKMAPIPDLYLRHARLLITKTLLTLYDVDLAPNAQSEGTLRGEGKAGIGKDKGVDCSASFDRLPIGAWLPSNWKAHFTGLATGAVHWTGKNPKLETSSGEGSLRVRGARIEHLPLLEELAAVDKSFGHLQLNDCAMDVQWNYPCATIKNIALEDKGKFRMEGAISIDRDSLGGTVELGLARQHLDWLPKPEEVFTRQQRGYLWTTVHLSGTVDEPKQDLSPRVADAIKESPGTWLSLLFHEIGQWLKENFGRDH